MIFVVVVVVVEHIKTRWQKFLPQNEKNYYSKSTFFVSCLVCALPTFCFPVMQSRRCEWKMLQKKMFLKCFCLTYSYSDSHWGVLWRFFFMRKSKEGAKYKAKKNCFKQINFKLYEIFFAYTKTGKSLCWNIFVYVLDNKRILCR